MSSWRLNKLTVKNFKYFFNQQTLDIAGWNILFYGENGSGKSSVYWVLYTLLQAALKESTDDVKKYFDATKNENLRNKNISDPNIDSFVEAQWELFTDNLKKDPTSATITQKIDFGSGLVESEVDYSLLTARASDFINYKGLLKLFDFSNSKQCDLFNAFEADFFPYWFNTSFKNYDGNQMKNADLYWKYLLSIPDTLPDNTSNKELKRSDGKYKFLKNSLIDFQQALDIELQSIQDCSNDIIQHEFNLPIKIELVAEGVDFDVEYIGHPNVHDRTIHPPRIKASISILTDDFTNIRFEVSHPASYFNEAKLTCIALSVRLAMMQWHPGRLEGYKYGKLLCLDDLLVSLDMPNRANVVSVVLGHLTDDFQILMFTHDPIFNNLIKDQIQKLPKEKKKRWTFYEVFATDTELDRIEESPIIMQTQSYIEKAKASYRSKDFGSCGNYLRKECEHILCELLPLNLTLEPQQDGTIKKKDLNGLIDEWGKFLKRFGTTLESTTPNLHIYRQHVWNPLSHNDLDTPIFRQELYDSIKELEVLQTISKTEPLSSNSYVYENEGCKITFDFGGNNYTCRMKPKDKFLMYTILGVDYYLDVDVEATDIMLTDLVNPEKKVGTATGIQTIGAVYKEMLAAAGTDEATAGKWYENTFAGKNRYEKLKKI